MNSLFLNDIAEWPCHLTTQAFIPWNCSTKIGLAHDKVGYEQ